MIDKDKILAGRKAVDAYREAHRVLHSKPWHKGIPDEHTPLLIKLIDDLEKLGFTSTKLDFGTKRSEVLAKFHAENRKQCLEDTGVYDLAFYKLGEYLDMIGLPREFEGAEIRQTERGRDLVIDGKVVMNTSVGEHASMMLSVADCPDEARVFIGGLGFGLVLAYLVHSGKAKEIIVCEVDDRVIHLLGQRITDYLEYPIQIIHGDAHEEIQKHGKFDWIYIDLSGGSPPEFVELSKPALTDRGVFTPYNPNNWEVWA